MPSGKMPYNTRTQDKLFNDVLVPSCLNHMINLEGGQEQSRNVFSLNCRNWSCLLDSQCTRLITRSQFDSPLFALSLHTSLIECLLYVKVWSLKTFNWITHSYKVHLVSCVSEKTGRYGL